MHVRNNYLTHVYRYGDYVPSSFPAKAFMIIWILTGLVVVSIFGGAVSSGMSVANLDKEYKLYGTKVRDKYH